jgi:hypothetical protein
MTYEEEIEYLKRWIEDRIEWMDDHLRLGPSPVASDEEMAELDVHLYQNMPNPFNSQTVITYELESPARVRLEIYNLLGQNVRTLVEGGQAGGSHRVLWDGRDLVGRIAPAGVYTFRLATDSGVITRKMLFLR